MANSPKKKAVLKKALSKSKESVAKEAKDTKGMSASQEAADDAKEGETDGPSSFPNLMKFAKK